MYLTECGRTLQWPLVKCITLERNFTYKELLQAGAIIMKDGPDFLSRVTKIEALNARMRLADFDMNKLSQRLVSNKSGLSNLSRYTYWFTTAPDYYNRMTMFIAQKST